MATKTDMYLQLKEKGIYYWNSVSVKAIKSVDFRKFAENIDPEKREMIAFVLAKRSDSECFGDEIEILNTVKKVTPSSGMDLEELSTLDDHDLERLGKDFWTSISYAQFFAIPRTAFVKLDSSTIFQIKSWLSFNKNFDTRRKKMTVVDTPRRYLYFKRCLEQEDIEFEGHTWVPDEKFYNAMGYKTRPNQSKIVLLDEKLKQQKIYSEKFKVYLKCYRKDLILEWLNRIYLPRGCSAKEANFTKLYNFATITQIYDVLGITRMKSSYFAGFPCLQLDIEETGEQKVKGRKTLYPVDLLCKYLFENAFLYRRYPLIITANTEEELYKAFCEKLKPIQEEFGMFNYYE